MENAMPYTGIIRFEGVYFGPDGSQNLWYSEYNTEHWHEKSLYDHLTKMKPIWLEECEKIVPYRIKVANNGYRLLSHVSWDEVMDSL